MNTVLEPPPAVAPQIVVPAMNVIAENRAMREEILAAISAVIEHGQFMLGGEVDAFEVEAARYLGMRHVIGLNSGTDALLLALKALDVGPGDEVITVANSFVATAGAVRQIGAVPFFVDVGADENMDPQRLGENIGPRTRAIIPVHLRGRPADIRAIRRIAADAGVPIVEDASQAFGATVDGTAVGKWGTLGAFSLHPQKVLGAIGDAGIVATDDDRLADRIRLLRHHGLKLRDEVHVWGQNSRLDTIQAAALRVKLRRIPDWIERRRAIAAAYREALSGLDLVLPAERPGERSVYYHYSVLTDRRDALAVHLTSAGVDARIHYPIPIHRQKGAMPGTFRVQRGGLPETEAQALRQLTLPVHPLLTRDQTGRVIDAVRSFFASRD
jgi:dTDP-4-amino-4,6-dideoxygalactose transaminase